MKFLGVVALSIIVIHCSQKPVKVQGTYIGTKQAMHSDSIIIKFSKPNSFESSIYNKENNELISETFGNYTLSGDIIHVGNVKKRTGKSMGSLVPGNDFIYSPTNLTDKGFTVGLCYQRIPTNNCVLFVKAD